MIIKYKNKSNKTILNIKNIKMSSKGTKQPNEFIGRKRKDSPIKNKIVKENGIAYMKYKLFKRNKYIILFGKNFVENNKKKCKIIISGKEYEMVEEINVKEFEKYDIKEKDRTLEIILKGEKITDMSYMFDGCVNLIKLDLSSFNTQNVKDISSMFFRCEKLIKLDLSSFNTQNVTNMRHMFKFYQNLFKLDLSSFNTKKESMPNMFDDYVSLVKIKLKNFNELKSFSKLIESRSFIVEV